MLEENFTKFGYFSYDSFCFFENIWPFVRCQSFGLDIAIGLRVPDVHAYTQNKKPRHLDLCVGEKYELRHFCSCPSFQIATMQWLWYENIVFRWSLIHSYSLTHIKKSVMSAKCEGKSNLQSIALWSVIAFSTSTWLLAR